MDSQCDYLVLNTPKCADVDEIESDCKLCNEPIRYVVQKWNRGSIRVSLEQAVAGAMVPYLDTGVSEHDFGDQPSKMSTGVCYATNDALIEVEGDVHLRDVPPNGTWLSSPTECVASIRRLRCAGLACIALPELNRMVLEQKNDDGLLHLTRECLVNVDNVSWAVQLFGAFACDALLAPVLHEILRSSWAKERKGLLDANNELKLGWAQEFYDYRRIPKDAGGSLLFTCLRGCGNSECHGEHLTITRRILGEMRLSGYTPWSAVRAVRIHEPDISNVACEHCKTGLLASCAFLTECAATEASRARDWLVRNEAVIQLCWILYNVHLNEPVATDHNLEHWSACTVAHSVKYQLYKSKEYRDIDALVILFANDHPPVKNEKRQASIEESEAPRDNDDMSVELENALLANGSYYAGESFNRADKVEDDTFNDIPTVLDLAESLPSGAQETRPQDPETATAAILLCFPRVAETAVSQLTFEPPAWQTSKLWPVFVNSTRACYQLFRALDLPVSPSPPYLLELLARGWRGIPSRTLQLFLPMTAGRHWRIEQKHYTEYFLGPLNKLFSLGVITESDRGLIIDALHRGLVPCFAGRGDSPCDRLLSSTLALSFAACGITALSQSSAPDASGLTFESVAVTSAGLLYFAAWYLMVYLSSVYSHRTLRIELSNSGSEADKCLCRAFRISEKNGSIEEYRGHDVAQALRLVFNGMLSDRMLLRLVQLYVPEMLSQLPYVRRTAIIPGNITSAMEARDVWYDNLYGHADSREDGRATFEYLGLIAYGIHSSLEGRRSLNTMRPVAKSLPKATGLDFDVWCDLLYVYNEHGVDVEDTRHLDAEDNTSVMYREDTLPFANSSDIEGSLSGSPDKYATPSSEASDISREYTAEEQDAESDSVLELPSLTTGIANLNISQDQLTTATANLNISQDQYVCKGFVFDTMENVGVTADNFLRRLGDTPRAAVRISHRVNNNPVITTPCMTNLSNTFYIVDEYDASHAVSEECIYPRLIQALWVLVSAHSQHASNEPKTAESLAVMVHLAAKKLPDVLRDQIPVCNDIIKLCGLCDREAQLVQITAIVGGMFGLNIQVIANGKKYTVANLHYKNSSPGTLCLTQRGWCIVEGKAVLRDSFVPVSTLEEYLRLNELAAIPVRGDGYCGFHTAVVLLGLSRARVCVDEMRGKLVQKTVKYIMSQKNKQRIRVYLEFNKIHKEQDLYALLMEDKRWLSVEDLYFILLAHGKKSMCITKQSYPLYSDDHVYFHIDNNHFQPVVRNEHCSAV